MTNVGTQGGNPAGLKKKGHFIEFKITDKNTGEPVKGVTVNVSYSDQSKNSLGTWKSGRAHFENIPDGACDLLDCRKGLVLMEEKETCRLKEGDSLHSIAERERGNGNDISWQDIAAFNWGDGARDLAVANEHMRDLFGCIHYDKLKGCLIYSAKEGMTHSLVIPKKIERKSLAIDRVHEIKVNNGPTSRQFLACTRLPNITFEPMRSFIRPNAASYLKKIVESAKEHPGSMFMLFGHADKVGTDEFNKSLSERRARSAYALLTKNPSAWLTYYKDGIDPDNEGWGIKNVQVILNFLNPDARLDITNTLDPRTGAELEKYVKPAWQYECGEKVITEAALKSVFRIYMDRLVNGTNLSESDFFGLRHVGCGKFNPLVEMETAHEDNRRVTFFLFDQERLPVMPCSNSGMDPCRTQAGCKNPDEKPFRYNPSFTCSFYDGIARGCECEASVPDIISIDSHMHFMSGHCTPLPLIWNQLPNLPGKKKINRTKLDWAGKNILQFIPTQGGNAGITIMQQKATLEIADIGFNNNTESHRKLHPNFKAAGKNRELYTPMIAMPMDMSYAHYDGYKALPVYYKLLKKPYFMQYITTTETGTVQVKTVLWPDNICENTKDFATPGGGHCGQRQTGNGPEGRSGNLRAFYRG
jgi:outer membrane protein OmpA-like peptidoglycan-associated protein